MTLDELDEAWQVLTEREKTVIKSRFGLNGDKPQTLRQVGKQLGVSGERARDLQNIALSKLRRAGLHFEKYGEIRPALFRHVAPNRYIQKVVRPKRKKRSPRKRKPARPPLVHHSDAERIEWMEEAIKHQSLYIDYSQFCAWTLKLKELRVSEQSLRDLLDRAMMEGAKQ